VYDGKDVVVKERFPKKYRHPDLEKKLTKSRVNREVKALGKAFEAGIQTPQVLHVDVSAGKITMDFIQGFCLRELFEDLNVSENVKLDISTEFGRIVAKLHDAGIIHGDLTTSNILHDVNGNLVLIDFGLSKLQGNIEDKAVDLYVLERAFLSTHPCADALFENVITAYSSNLSVDQNLVLEKFKKVQQRGRKRMLLG